MGKVSVLKLKKSPLAVLCCCALGAPLVAAAEVSDRSGSEVFDLGLIEVNAREDGAVSDGRSVVTRDEIRNWQSQDVGDAVSRLPGVTLTGGGRRAETSAFIRGFDARQITLNVDGNPVYLPYDGNIDLGRFLSADFSKIVVSKSLGSLLYGPNNMGGSINLVTRRPTEPFAGTVSGSTFFGRDGLYTTAVNSQLGGKLNQQFYVQGGLSYRNADDYPLSDDFSGNAVQPSGNRLNSGSRDTSGNFKLGFTPNASDEYTLSYYRVEGRKDASPYAGGVPGNLVWWDWPQWDKESVYYIGHTAVGAGYVKTRLFYDTFNNKLNAYDNASMTSTKLKSSFKSAYDDHSMGGSIEGGLPLDAHMLRGLAFYKQDKHSETDLAKDGKAYDSPWLDFEAWTASFGLEDEWTLNEKNSLTLGYRYDRHKVDQAQEYADGKKTQVKNMTTGEAENANNLLLVYNHKLSQADTLRAGVSMKTRFATLKEMYSYRLGRAIPNPGLKPEQAVQFEVGAAGRVFGKARYDAAIYYADLDDAIESVSLTPSLQQMQNVGTARNYGFEGRIDLPLGDDWVLLMQYTWLKRELGAANLVPTLTPEHQFLTTLSWFPQADVELDLDVEAYSKRETTTDGLRPTAGYALANLRTRYAFSKDVQLQAGLFNLLDQNYQISEGDPMPGRTLRASLNVSF